MCWVFLATSPEILVGSKRSQTTLQIKARDEIKGVGGQTVDLTEQQYKDLLMVHVADWLEQVLVAAFTLVLLFSPRSRLYSGMPSRDSGKLWP